MAPIRILHDKLFHSHTPFAYASICGLVIGVGDIIATGTDIIWLIGDMNVHLLPHHPWIMGGLVVGLVIMLLSFYWLYRAIHMFVIKRNRKLKKALKKRARRVARGKEEKSINGLRKEHFEVYNKWMVYY